MIQKFKVVELITKHEKEFKVGLGIKTKVRWHIINSQSKKCKMLSITRGHEKGLSFVSSEGVAEIFIFFDQHYNLRDTLGTIFHELLHVRVSNLTNLITMHMIKGSTREEKLVRDLEEYFLHLFWEKHYEV